MKFIQQRQTTEYIFMQASFFDEKIMNILIYDCTKLTINYSHHIF